MNYKLQVSLRQQHPKLSIIITYAIVIAISKQVKVS